MLPSLGDVRSLDVCPHCNHDLSTTDFSVHTVVQTKLVIPPRQTPHRQPAAESIASAPPVAPVPPSAPARPLPPAQPVAHAEPPPVASSFQAERAPVVDSPLELVSWSEDDQRESTSLREDSSPPAPAVDLGLPVFELEAVGAQGYDDRIIVRSFDFGTLVRCMVGMLWGLVALQGIAWWAFRADPIGLAKLVPPEIAVILPAELRPEPVEPPRRQPSPPLTDDLLVTDDAPTYETNQRDDAASTPPAVETVTAQTVTSEASDLTPGTDVPGTPDSRLVSHQSEVAVPNELTPGTKLERQGAAGGAAVPDYVTASAPPRLHPESIFIGSGPRYAKESTIEDVDAASAAARRANQGFDQAQLFSQSAPAKQKAAKLCYAVFSSLAERATMVNQDGAEQCTSQSRDALRDLAGNPDKVQMFSNAARNWIARRLGNGVVAGAHVHSIREVGDLYELDVQLMDNKRTVATIVTRCNPADNPWTTFAVGDRILFGGVTVDRPEVRLPDYLGNESWVIYMTNQMVQLP